MRQNNETQTIGDLINASTFKEALNSTKMQSVIKHSTIFSFWEDIVGKKFVKFTRPYSLKYSTLYVSVKSPVIAQELDLYKSTLLKKINSYSMPLGIEVKKIQFNYKNFEKLENEDRELNEVEDKPVWYSDNELLKVEIDKNTVSELEKHISSISFLNDEQKKKLVNKIIANYKAKFIRNTTIND